MIAAVRYMFATCDHDGCRTSEENHDYRSAFIKRLRGAGWSVGTRVLCPDHARPRDRTKDTPEATA